MDDASLVYKIHVYAEFRESIADNLSRLMLFFYVKVVLFLRILVEFLEAAVGSLVVVRKEHDAFCTVEFYRYFKLAEHKIAVAFFFRRGKYLCASGGRLRVDALYILGAEEILERFPKAIIYTANRKCLGRIMLKFGLVIEDVVFFHTFDITRQRRFWQYVFVF